MTAHFTTDFTDFTGNIFRSGLFRRTGSASAPKLRKIIVAHLDELNGGGLTLPDGSGRPLPLRLTRKEQISVRINDNPAD